jgi:hypothetical protein
VLAREPERSPELERLTVTCLAFLEAAQRPAGDFYNRRSAVTGAWSEPGAHDANGRALFGLGLAASLPGDAGARALARFEAAAAFDLPGLRPNAWAALGASAVLEARPAHAAAAALLERASRRLGVVSPSASWPWPEPRLAYDNARLAHARIAAGRALGDEALVDEGLTLLAWLVDTESLGGRFSFAPTAGRGPGEAPPAFDQQPIEAGSMAEACAAAFDATGDEAWADLTVRAAQWFLGANDTGVPLLDPVSGGCCDGLTATGRNENQGAESTLALIAAFQMAARAQSPRRSAVSRSSVETSAAPTFLSAAP